MNISLFFGTFNPIHCGHLLIGTYLLNHTETDEVWYVVNPTVPFKEHDDLLPFEERVTMAKLACMQIRGHKLKVCTIEEELDETCRTYDTISTLKVKYPEHNFSIIIGADNLAKFNTWYRWEDILKENKIFVYPRKFKDCEHEANVPYFESEYIDNIVMLNAATSNILVPWFDISSTFIRKEVKNGNSLAVYVPYVVEKYIKDNGFYKHE